MKQEVYKNEAAVILLGVMSEFPGLMHGDEEVDGSALIEFLTVAISNMTKEAKNFAAICTDARGAK